MAELTHYEQEQVAEIQAWRAEEPGVVSRAVGWVTQPLAWVVQQLIPTPAIRGVLDGANWAADHLANTKGIIRQAGVVKIEDLRRQDLELCDRLANEVHNWAIGYAIAEGSASGATGLPGLLASIPAIILLALRTIHKIGLCYGYQCSQPEERQFILRILSAAGANSLKEKTASLVLLRELQIILARETWKHIMKEGGAKRAAIIATRNLARQLGVNLTKRKALAAVPVVGAVVGGSADGWFIKDVGWAARRVFQERWLNERHQTEVVN